MNDFVVTISRAYGSGGHDIGKRLAALLNVPFYDREIVALTAQKHGLDEESLQEMEEQSKLPSRFDFSPLDTDSDDRMFILQSQTIIELAKQPCVIVGRCADFVLQEHPGRCSFFLYSGLKQRLAHMRRESGVYRAAAPVKEVERMDRRRAAYYKYHTGQEWGQPANYHLCVDTGMLGAHTAELLAEFVRLHDSCKEALES